jgi:hypothetical protein
MTYKSFLIVAVMTIFATTAAAQALESEITAINDSALQIMAPSDSLAIDSLFKSIDGNTTLHPDNSRAALKRSESNAGRQPVKLWKPDPAKATWLALVIPGGGQIYNRKYWKLPIVYGGFVGCLYAYNWNSQMYKDYRQAYLDIMDSDPNTDSYKDFFRPGYDFDANKEYVENVFKKRKDRYRRWRDLSIFATIAVYALSVVDAYVDAQLANFDISEDINLSIEPHIMNGGGHEFGKSNRFTPKEGYYGLNCNITF